MSDATQAVTEAANEATDKPKKKRTRRTHRLGVSMALKELAVPDGGHTAPPEDWDLNTHKELRADEFSDVLEYFKWLKTYASKLIEASDAKITELEAFGDADTRKEMSELFGGTEQLAMAAASAMKKEGLSDEQKAAAAAKVKEILSTVFGGV